MSEEEKNFEVAKKIGYIVGIHCNDEEIEIFNKFLEDYKDKNNLIEKQQNEIENSVSKDKIRELINERQFELQQEYKDFKDDVRLNTLQEIYYIERK